MWSVVIVIMNEQDRVVISKLRQITLVSLLFMSIEFLGGYYAHSIAIFADAFHLLSDVSAYVISLYAVYKSHQLSPKNLTFGFEKVQPLGALINVAIIWVVTLELFLEATNRIFSLTVVENPLVMLGTSVFGLLCNLYIMRVLHSDEHAGGHHGCSHSHHGHNHGEGEEESPHGIDCNHSHEMVHSHDHHQHGSGCSHEHEHAHHHQEDQNQHNHHEHKNHLHHDQYFHGNSSGHVHKHSSTCNHSHEERNMPQSHRKMSDQLLPALIPSMQPPASSFHNNINIEAAYIHILTDIILSIGVIISAGIIYFFAPEGHIWTYWQLADPLCTYLFSFMAIYSTLPIVRESMIFLLDGCTDGKLLGEIERQLGQDEAVEAVECLKVWSTNRGKHYGALRVRIKLGRSSSTLSTIFSSRGVQGFVQLVAASQSHQLSE